MFPRPHYNICIQLHHQQYKGKDHDLELDTTNGHI